MAKAQQTQVVITANAATAKKVMDELQKKIDAIKQKMTSLDTTTKQGKKEFETLRKALVSYNSAVAENLTNTERIDRAMKNLSGSTLGQLKRALASAKSELNKMSENNPKLQQMRTTIQTLQGQIDKLNGTVKKSNGVWGTAMKNMTAYFGAFQLFSMATRKVKEFMDMNLKLSDQLADIRKVSGLAMDDINNLSADLAKIDTRTSQTELNQIAYAGAKLGMGKYGVEGLKQFTEAANQVNVALKEDLGSDALTALSKLTETMGLIPKLGVEQSMLATGSAMFKLSSTSTATANNIVEFSKRLTGVASTAGITTDQLLAMGSAADSMYLMPEVASTAMGKLIVALQKNHNLIAKQLNIPDETIKNLYSSGRAMDALVLIFEKMREKGNMNALAPIFKDLGSDGQRLITATVTMSKNVDMLKEHLRTSKEAFEDATAVTQEYNIQQNTANALVERANNLWVKAFINPKGVDNVHDMAQAWYTLSKWVTESPLYTGAIQSAIWLLIKALQALILLMPAITTFLMMKGVMTVALNLNVIWRDTITILRGMRTALVGATAAQTALNAAQKANVYAAIASVIITIVSALWSWSNAMKEARGQAEKFVDVQRAINDGLAEAAANARDLKGKVDGYVSALKAANVSQKTRQSLIGQFNSEFGSYLKNLGIEINTIDDLRKNYNLLNQEIEKRAYYEMKGKTKDKVLGGHRSDVVNAMANYQAYLDKHTSMTGFSSKWVAEQMDKGASAQKLYERIITGSNGGRFRNLKFNGKNYSYDYGTNSHMANDVDEELYGALQWIQNARRRYNEADQKIDKAYSFLGDYKPYPDDKLGNLDKDAPDKEAEKARKAALLAQKKEWRQQLKEAQDQANAIIDKIKDYYERQITEFLKIANSTEMNEDLQKQFTDELTKQKNDALAAARKAITGSSDEWNKYKKGMESAAVGSKDSESYKGSMELLNKIENLDLKKLRDLISKLSKNLGRPEGGFWDEIRKNATLNEKSNATIENKAMRARLQAELEDNYTGKVDKQYEDEFYRFGLAALTEEQRNTILHGSTEDAEKVQKDRIDAMVDMFKNARENIAGLYTSDKREDVLSLLFGQNWEEELKASPLSGLLELQGDDFKLFYNTLIKYSDDYVEAQKKAADRMKKVYDYLWNQSPQKKENTRSSEINGEQKTIYDSMVSGSATHAAFNMDDPEIIGYQLKLELAKQYYDFIEAHQHTEEQLLDAQKAITEAQNNLTKNVIENWKARMDAVQTMIEPLATFGTAAGEAFATMTEDAEEGRDALNTAIQEMIKSLMELTVKMTIEYTNQNMMRTRMAKAALKQQKKDDKKQVKETQDSEDEKTDIIDTAGTAQQILTQSVAMAAVKIKKQEAQATTQTQKEQTATEVATAQNQTIADVVLGIAGGSAKIIETLGWWGIPLIAVITALLNGLLSFATSKVSSLFGGSSSSSSDSASVNTKLVSGMLTYDEGNVSSFVGSDGKVYAARDAGALPGGVSMVNSPIATTVNGEPSLVGEQGREIVIGRETTAAIMQDAPALISMLAAFDKNSRFGGALRTFDDGNVSDAVSAISGASSGGGDTQMAELMQSMLYYLQNPVQPNINMYGRGGLQNKMGKANKFINSH